MPGQDIVVESRVIETLRRSGTDRSIQVDSGHESEPGGMLYQRSGTIRFEVQIHGGRIRRQQVRKAIW
ncbi:MAG: hypothetical protein ACLR7F_13655 [Waltera sp.]